MRNHNKKLPIWVHFITDLLCIALCTFLFYELYYHTPTELESENIVIDRTIKNVSSDSSFSAAVASTTDEFSYLSGWALQFPEKFSESIFSTDTTYSSPALSITLTTNTKGSGNSLITYYVADIYISDIECLQSGFANDTYGVGYAQDLTAMSERLCSVLAINGDYYGNSRSGVVIRNGVVYRTDVDSADVCVLYYDGTMATYSPEKFDIDSVIGNSPYQAWSFGPALLSESGEPLTEFNSSVTPKNPRSAIGYYEPGHYCFVLVDGRSEGYSCGMDMAELSILMNELGCKVAYNLDGGQSSVMTLYDDVVNQPYLGGRALSDCVIIKELE